MISAGMEPSPEECRGGLSIQCEACPVRIHRPFEVKNTHTFGGRLRLVIADAAWRSFPTITEGSAKNSSVIAGLLDYEGRKIYVDHFFFVVQRVIYLLNQITLQDVFTIRFEQIG